MIDMQEIKNPDAKSEICETILRTLPEWFGIESALLQYVEAVRDLPFFIAKEMDSAIGFAALKQHNPYTAEIYVTGVLREHHRQGIGRKLIETCKQVCLDCGVSFLTVKTLDESAHSEEYARTRQFYHSIGFRPLEVFPLHWDEENPCLFLAMYLGKSPLPS